MGTTFSFPTKPAIALMPISGVVSFIAGLGYVVNKAFTLDGSGGPAAEIPHYDAHIFTPVLLVTTGWGLLYYSFLFDQSATAFVQTQVAKEAALAIGAKPPTVGDIKYGVVPNLKMRCADRTVGNYVEQSIPFMVALWSHAIFISPVSAARCGWTWLFCRSYYPFVYGQVPRVFLSTVPAYGVVFYMMGKNLSVAMGYSM